VAGAGSWVVQAVRGDHAHIGGQQGGQSLQQLARAGHLARQAVTYPHGDSRRCVEAALGVFAHHVEVVIEAGDFKDLGLRQAQQLGQRGEVVGLQLAEAVVDGVQVFDQQIAPQWRLPDGGANRGERCLGDRAFTLGPLRPRR
jgi:hypothetical protein